VLILFGARPWTWTYKKVVPSARATHGSVSAFDSEAQRSEKGRRTERERNDACVLDARVTGDAGLVGWPYLLRDVICPGVNELVALTGRY